MSDRNYADYIDDIKNSIQLILDFTSDLSFEDFQKDIKTQYAVIRCLEVIGEAAKRIPENIRLDNPEIPWKIMAGMRDRLIHGYDFVNETIVWKTIKSDIPELKNKIDLI